MNTTRDTDPTNPLPAPGEWARLTLLPAKHELFAKDIYFRECWADVVDVLGDERMAVLGSLAVLNFKPDAVVGRRGRAALDYAVERGFVPVASRPIAFTRLSMREIWRYNWNFATIDRIAMSSLMYGATGVLMLLLRDDRFDGTVPGSVRLSGLKGSARPGAPPAARAEDRSLRETLRLPHRLINFVHVCDEPADIVREFGVLFDRHERRALLAEILANHGTDRRTAVAAAIDELEARYPPHDLDLGGALRRLERTGALGPADAARLDAAARGGPALSWPELVALLDPDDPRTDGWDFITVASAVLRDERDGFEDLLPSVSVEEWQRSAAAR